MEISKNIQLFKPQILFWKQKLTGFSFCQQMIAFATLKKNIYTVQYGSYEPRVTTEQLNRGQFKVRGFMRVK